MLQVAHGKQGAAELSVIGNASHAGKRDRGGRGEGE